MTRRRRPDAAKPTGGPLSGPLSGPVAGPLAAPALATDSTVSPKQDRLAAAFRFVVYPAILLAALTVLAVRPIPDPDTWFHMAFGRVVLDTGEIPRGDVFSHTSPGGEWISSGWAPSVAMEWIYRRGGAKGLAWMVFAVAALGYGLLYFTGVVRYRLRGGGLALLLLAAMAAGYLRFTPRPEIWSQVFLAAVLVLLITAGESPRLREGRLPRRLWALPILFAAWANCHAGFMVGYAPVGIFCLWNILEARREGRVDRLWVLIPCGLSGVAWVLNPYGARLVALAGKIRAIPHVRDHIMEWMPLWATTNPTLPEAAVLGIAAFLGLTVLVAALAWQKGRLPGWHVAAILFFTALMFYQRRHAGLAAVAISAALLPHLAALDDPLAKLRGLAPIAAAGVLALLGFAQHDGALQVGRGLYVTGIQGGILPARAANFLVANRPPGQLFNSYGTGGYLLYFLAPEPRVFIDGRLDVYDPKVWLDYLAIESGAMSIADATRKYDLNTFVVFTKDIESNPNNLALRLSDQPDWRLVYFDDAYGVFVRESPAARDYVGACQFRYVQPYRPERFEAAVRNPSTRDAALAELDRAVQTSHNGVTAMALRAVVERIRAGEAGGKMQSIDAESSR